MRFLARWFGRGAAIGTAIPCILMFSFALLDAGQAATDELSGLALLIWPTAIMLMGNEGLSVIESLAFIAISVACNAVFYGLVAAIAAILLKVVADEPTP